MTAPLSAELFPNWHAERLTNERSERLVFEDMRKLNFGRLFINIPTKKCYFTPFGLFLEWASDRPRFKRVNVAYVMSIIDKLV